MLICHMGSNKTPGSWKKYTTARDIIGCLIFTLDTFAGRMIILLVSFCFSELYSSSQHFCQCMIVIVIAQRLFSNAFIRIQIFEFRSKLHGMIHKCLIVNTRTTKDSYKDYAPSGLQVIICTNAGSDFPVINGFCGPDDLNVLKLSSVTSHLIRL